jgi:hypothetical protein
MRAKLTSRNLIIAGLVSLFLIQVVSIGLLAKANRDTNNQLKSEQSSKQLIYSDLDTSVQQLSPSVPADKNQLYIPELNIIFPMNQVTRSIRYNLNQGLPGDDSGNIRINSSYMTDHSMHIQSCADMVRLKIEAKPNAYSPDQPLYATVQLSDGRMLQIYASTTKDCQSAWQVVSPQKIAEELKNSQSY